MEARDKEFRVLDLLIEAGWGEVPQQKIKPDVLRKILSGEEVRPHKRWRDPDRKKPPIESPEARARRLELAAERKRKADDRRMRPASQRMAAALERFRRKGAVR